MWGPILAWCALELLAESIDNREPERVALDLFDRLRLREPFAQAFTALGFEGEEAWRVAARIKVVLLTGAGVGKDEETSELPEPSTLPAAASSKKAKTPEKAATASNAPTPPPSVDEPTTPIDEKVALAPALWFDPDVHWLTGVHEAGGHLYLVRESYEELLWWLLMPSLLRLAGEKAPSRADVEELSKTVEEALATAEAARYRIDVLLGSAAPESDEAEPLAVEGKSEIIAEGIGKPVEPGPEEPTKTSEP